MPNPAWFALALSAVGILVTIVLYRTKTGQEFHDRVVKLETQMELILGGMIAFSGPKVHSPHAGFEEIDELIDKQRKTGLSEPEIGKLIGLLEMVATEGPEEKRPVASLMLAALKAKHLPSSVRIGK